MELKDFVKTALIQLTEAVSEAQEATRETGALINPGISRETAISGTQMYNTAARHDPTEHPIQMVEFDAAVTVTETGEADVGARISILGAVIGAGGAAGSESTSVSRIKFTVPVVFKPTGTPA